MNELKKEFNKDYSYPKQNDKHIQSKIFLKKEFYNYRIKHNPAFNDYVDLKKYRDLKCFPKTASFSNYQIMLSQIINPDTPYKSLLLFHGLGSGKTAAAISIAETFKETVEKYNTKIYILVPGPTLKENWKNELYIWTKNKYLQDINDDDLDNEEKQKNMVLQNINSYYNIISYKTFYRQVLGEKIKNTSDDGQGKYKKDENNEFIRTEHFNKIEELNNTLLIIDEAHNVVGNNNGYGEAVKKIINKSKNLKVLLLTGTPMSNSADEILEMFEVLRPDYKVSKTDIFKGNSNFNLELAPNGDENLRNLVRGYVSYIKGEDPYLFAVKNEIGEIPKSLKFTKIIPCKTTSIQKIVYDEHTNDYNEGIDKMTADYSNFVYPLLDEKDEIIGTSGKFGREQVINKLKLNEKKYNEALSKFLGLKNVDLGLIKIINNKVIGGRFMKEEYLKNFSIKFYTALKNLNNLVINNKQPKPAFIYCNLVDFGIKIFKQVLIENGYIEFDENINKTMSYVNDYTKCYYCGKTHIEHENIKKNNHDFYPACFLSITGQMESEEESGQDESRKIIEDIFNRPDNFQGKYIKFILGSRVLAEGFSLKNVGEVHILDVWWNFSRLDQVIGRGVRRCSHYNTYSEINPNPKVDIYKYCIVSNNISIDERLYQAAEKKLLLVKKCEKILKEESIDCGLNLAENNNMYQIEKTKDCQVIDLDKPYEDLNLDTSKPFCPVNCEFGKCDYKCSDKKLDKYYNNKTKSYNDVPEDEIDETTYNLYSLIYEINKCKDIIKNLFLFKYIYTIDEIIKFTQLKYNDDNLFDVYYVYKALDDLIPLTENDFINFKDTIIDKYNRPGYLIYINGFYIYQPFGENKNIPMYYRENYDFKYDNSDIKLFEFMKFNNQLIRYNEIYQNKDISDSYDFDTVIPYYQQRKEADFVGCIDKINKTKADIDDNDIFKLREKIKVKTNKKRESGLQTYKGSTCFNSYKYDYIKKVLKKLDINYDTKKSYKRNELCDMVKEKLIELEKYSTDNTTYLIIPANHPKYEFPLNLKDRCDYISEKISEHFNNKHIKISIEKINKKKYHMTVSGVNDDDFMFKYKFTKNKVSYIRDVE